MRKKIIGISLVLIILSLFFYFLSDSSFSYSTTYSHPKLTKEIVDLYNRVYSKNQITQQEIEWLVKGAIEEDAPLRYINHFYDPIYNQPWLGSNPIALTAKEWAQSPNYQLIFAKGNQSWQKAIESYTKDDKKSSFIALGHILHLIEDMAVSEHTRNDTHIPYIDESPYENWVEKYGVNDSISYRNIKSCLSLNECFNGLANYSNKNFFSEDTAGKNVYASPFVDETKIKDIKDRYGNIATYAFWVDDEQQEFRLVEIIRQPSWRYSEKEIVYKLDDIVLSNYFSLLGPRAISHGAGVIKLFFEEAEKQKQLEEQKSWWQKVKERAGDLFSATLISLVKEEPAPASTQPLPSPSQEPLVQPIQSEISPEKEEIVVISTPSPQVPKPLSEEPKTQKTEQPQTQPKTEKPKPEEPKQTEPESKPEEISKTPEKPSEQESPPSSEYKPIITGSATPSHHDEPILPDNEPPETYATSTLFADNQSVATSTAIFEFSSSEANSTFECILDDATSTVCESPKEYSNLTEGSHTFKVKAIDSVGNQDESPATISWTVDITPPVLSNISASATRNSATISWVSSEAGIFQISYGTSTNYGFVTATTSNTTLSISSLSVGTTYYYQIQAQDQLGNSTSSPDNVLTTSTQAQNIVISEIKIAGSGGADDEWIELYNPISQAVDLSSWSIQFRGSGAQDYQKRGFNSTSTIPALGFFLIASNGYTGSVPADLVYPSSSFYLSGTGGTIFLVDNNIKLTSATSTSIIDKISYGTGTYLFPEGKVFIPAPSNLQSLERKATATSTAESLATGVDKWLGNGYDTDNNNQDFVLQTSPTPQNSLSLIEPRDSLPVLATDSSWSMKQKNSKRQAQILVSGLASTTLQVSSSTLVSSPPEGLTSLSLSNSHILVGSTIGLFASSSISQQEWFYPTTDIGSPPLVSSDGTIYARADDALYAFTSQGMLKWKYPIDGNYYNFSLNIDKNGIIYTVASNGRVYAFYPDGKIKWIFDISQPPVLRSFSGHIGSPAIDNERERIYLNIEQYLYALDFNGNFVWDFRNSPLFPTSTTTSFSSPAIGADGTIYFSTLGQAFASGGFYALNPDGTAKWFNSIGYGGNASRSPAIGSDGTVYFVDVRYSGGGAGAELFAFDPTDPDPTNNHLKWHTSLPTSDISSPIVTSDTIYVASRRYILAFNFDGSERWRWAGSYGAYFASSFGAVNSDGSLYFTSRGTLYRLSN